MHRSEPSHHFGNRKVMCQDAFPHASVGKTLGNGRLTTVTSTGHAAKLKDGQTVVTCPLFEPVHQLYKGVTHTGLPCQSSTCCICVKECLRSKERKHRGLGLAYHQLNKYENISAYQLVIEFFTGDPGVFFGNPHPYPWKPVPVPMGVGFHGYGCRFDRCLWVWGSTMGCGLSYFFF